ncbi:MAG TPA: prenyltransferase/squalene oxidase repeat-containing protein [Pirellulales bacterium]|nr:prenyltransferase/squalene oxidase repeat-containing protein [Pirellulales bacterium]
MNPQQHCSWRRWCGLGLRLAGVCAILGLLASCARALTPESPEVKASVAKAVEYLATQPDSYGGAGGRPGARALVALVMVKADLPNHPRVQEGLDAVRNQVLKNPNEDVYTVGLSLILLTELPPERQREYYQDLEQLLERLKGLQKPFGGWGYPYLPTGDTSMTQYAALGLWSAAGAGFEAPPDVWEKLCNWLIRTQAPNGGFGYQGKDPGGYNPVEQDRVSLSMCSAGSASLYVCADHFGMFAAEQKEDDGTNPKLKPRKTNQTGAPSTGTVDPSRLRAAIGKADLLLANFVPEPPDPMHAYPYYYIYASERYRSFRDYAEGRMQKNGYEPEWYTVGARHLMSKQAADGSWRGTDPSVGIVPDTCFATLFLLRSMLKTIRHIKKLDGGTLTGGRGLPEDMEHAKFVMGGLKAERINAPILDLLKKVADSDDPDNERALASMEDGLEPGDEIKTEVAKQLQQLARGKSPKARAAALQALARTRDLDQVPLLIEALKDPDPLVFHGANEGLRFLSRKFYGAGFWGGTDEKTRQDAIKQWTDWYLSVRPGAILD